MGKERPQQEDQAKKIEQQASKAVDKTIEAADATAKVLKAAAPLTGGSTYAVGEALEQGVKIAEAGKAAYDASRSVADSGQGEKTYAVSKSDHQLVKALDELERNSKADPGKISPDQAKKVVEFLEKASGMGIGG